MWRDRWFAHGVIGVALSCLTCLTPRASAGRWRGGQSAQRARAVVRGAAQAAPADRGSVYSRQIFQITPVPGIWTSGASAATLNLLAGSDWPKSRTAP